MHYFVVIYLPFAPVPRQCAVTALQLSVQCSPS